MADLTLTQRIVIACDEFVAGSDTKPGKPKDRQTADFLAGAATVLQQLNTTEFNNTAGILCLIGLGGYSRVHDMAVNARKMGEENV